jgi:hypothetical protein
MQSERSKRLLVVSAIVAVIATLPAAGYAQEAMLTGTVIDSTGAVLPGVTITAVHLASGNTFVGLTDARGAYQIPIRTGVYRLKAALAGFASIDRTDLEVLVGQQAVVNFELRPPTVEESVTVTGRSPLVDISQSHNATNIDPRQLSELPINGRNWLDLTMLAAGSRVNNVSSDDFVPQATVGNAQLNVDGHQVTSNISATGFGQPHYARDAIGEFEFVANRFDASQGRSAGVQVNAVTKAGTNRFSGQTSAYFRSDKWNAADFIVNRVLPYSNQQSSTTFGGPIKKDKIHFFADYEYEREPSTQSYTTQFPSFNVDLTGNRTDPKGGGRLDFQFSNRLRLMVRGNLSRWYTPYDPRYTGGSSQTTSSSESTARPSNELYVALTQVLGSASLNEVKVGYDDFLFRAIPTASYPSHPGNAFFPANAVGRGAPRIMFSGFAIGQAHTNAPQANGQTQYSFRDDFRTLYNRVGRHSLHVGAEWLHQWGPYFQCTNCMGTYDAGTNRPPTNIEQYFPNVLDVSTWNLAPMSSLFRTYTIGISAVAFKQYTPKEIGATWVQDDWTVASRLTLNVGLRYDIESGMFAERRGIEPWLPTDRPIQKDRFGPRFGFAFNVDDRTVIRGGWGKYFADVSDQVSSWTERYGSGEVNAQFANNGRPDFGGNPLAGAPLPTYEQALLLPGLRKSVSQVATPGMEVPYSYQSSIGFQRQLGSSMGLQADYVYNASRHQLEQHNINLTYNPATGAAYSSTDASRAPRPDWGTVNAYLSDGWSNFHALETAFNRRLSQRWQASATYTLSFFSDGLPAPLYGPDLRTPDIPLAADTGEQYGYATTDQRHRAVFNGIWEAGLGFQVSGLYFYGSGQRFATTYGGGDRPRLRPDGSIVPRNDFVGSPLHRVDVRLQRRFKLGGRKSADAMLETYNLFNHANYGSYTTAESNASYGKPIQNTSLAYQPRMLQLGFRIGF